MKKLLLATAVMFCVGVSLVRADRRLVPSGEANSLATADYGGVDYTTYTINGLVSGTGVGYGTATFIGANGNPLPTGTNPSSGVGGVFYGVQYSTGSTSDFVDVWDSTSADMTKISAQNFRIYNVGTSTGGVGAYAAGFSGPFKPIRFAKGLIYRPSRADFNSLQLLFYAHE